MHHLVGGVVDQDVDPAEFLDGCVDDGAAMRWVGKVAGEQHAIASGVLYEARDVAGVVVLVEIGDRFPIPR
ncbi:hypothetical protein MPRS_55070 [Mycobacterium paraseoulense]|nr:hypothetical protein MPRS_55070 [Mycobacterium paraseoulense]